MFHLQLWCHATDVSFCFYCVREKLKNSSEVDPKRNLAYHFKDHVKVSADYRLKFEHFNDRVDEFLKPAAGAASPENMPRLLEVMSSETNTSMSSDEYDSDIENPHHATPKKTFDAATAIPNKNKPDHSSYHPRSSAVSGSPLPSHVISISMPSSPAKFQMEGEKVVLRSQKVDEDAQKSKLQNSSRGSLNFAEIKPQKQLKADSQPIPTPTGNGYAEAMANGTISGVRHNFDSRPKDNNYDYFRTKSRKIERQLSRLRGKQPEKYNGVRPGDCEIESLSVGRYFDALQGAELEILREDSEELVLPTDKQWPFILRFPVSFFGVCLGVGSQAMLWKTLSATPSMSFLHVPEIVNLVVWCVALLTLIIISIVYASKCIFYFEAVRREYYHPVRVNFFFAPWIACMFLAIGVPPQIATSVHPAVWCVFMTPLLCLELKIYGQWMSRGDRRLSKVANPSNHLSIVGNFVGALLGAETGWKEGAIFYFSVGLAHYIVLFVTLYQRLPTNETLPQELHPVFFLFVAAPSVASVAWERIQGDFDYVSKIAYFIAIFLYASLAVRLNFFRGFRFSIAWWAYTFPTTGAAIAAINYSNKIRNPYTKFLAVTLAVISSLTVFAILVSTLLHAFVWDSLIPNDIAIAITDRKHRARKKYKKSALDQMHTVISYAVATDNILKKEKTREISF